MSPEVTIAITKVLRKYNLSIPDLSRKYIKFSNYVEARKEVAYVLIKEHSFYRREVADVLNCNLPQVTYLINGYCSKHKLPIPKYRTKEDHPVDKLHRYLLENKLLTPEYLKDKLAELYQLGYRAGHLQASRKAERAKSDVKSFPGVPRVPSVRNNAPVSISEAPRGILYEVKDDQERVEIPALRRNRQV